MEKYVAKGTIVGHKGQCYYKFNGTWYNLNNRTPNDQLPAIKEFDETTLTIDGGYNYNHLIMKGNGALRVGIKLLSLGPTGECEFSFETTGTLGKKNLSGKGTFHSQTNISYEFKIDKNIYQIVQMRFPAQPDGRHSGCQFDIYQNGKLQAQLTWENMQLDLLPEP